ncbi:hypothetical protein KXD93_02710 [Mucilaginibacter sp. BJC16-A38]|nr:hypothetical protein [Mucilaginibacter phenanthrenivorans]MCR8556533.1 hypothetical protein [Mucilaginibacter phenanthrenivorans]
MKPTSDLLTPGNHVLVLIGFEGQMGVTDRCDLQAGSIIPDSPLNFNETL